MQLARSPTASGATRSRGVGRAMVSSSRRRASRLPTVANMKSVRTSNSEHKRRVISFATSSRASGNSESDHMVTASTFNRYEERPAGRASSRE